MTVQERISKLNDLLERVRRNATAPRRPLAFAAPAPAEVSDEEPSGAAAPEPSGTAPSAELVAAAAPEPRPPAHSDAVLTRSAAAAAGSEADVVELEFLDEEIVDITDLPADDVELLEQEEQRKSAEAEGEEAEIPEPPASSRRPIPAASMDEALASATDRALEPEREVPLKTPPPESGRQVAMPPAAQLQQPPLPDLSPAAHGRAPSVEQLGGLVELEEDSPVDLELALPPVAPAKRGEAFEAGLEPAARTAGVEATAEARPGVEQVLPGSELERAGAPISEPAISQVVSVGSAFPAAKAPEPAADQPVAAAITPPPVAEELAVADQMQRAAAPAFAPVLVPSAPRRPSTFFELLEGSLSL